MRGVVSFAVASLIVSTLLCQLAVSPDQAEQSVQAEAGPWRDTPYDGAVTGALAWLGPNLVVVGTPRGVLISDADGRHREITLDPPLTDLGPGGAVCCAPTGDRFACLVGDSERGLAVVLSAEGAVLRTIAAGNPQPAFDMWAAWSLDGGQFFFSGATTSPLGAAPAYRLYRYDVSHAHARAVTSEGPWLDCCPSLGSDSTRVLFSRVYHERACPGVSTPEGPARESRVLLLDLADGAEMSVTEGNVDRKPVCSPDGRFVAFFRLEPHIGVSLWVAEVASGQAWPLVGGDAVRLSYHASLQWSADGARIYTASRGAVYAVRPPRGEFSRLSLAGTAPRGMFAVSPDDTHIAYLTETGYRIEEVAYAQ